MPEINKTTIQQRLEEELELLKKKWGTARELRVIHAPESYGKETKNKLTIYGETVGSMIFIYIPQADLAVQTLFHEFFEYVICAPIELSLAELFNSLQQGYAKAIDQIVNAYNEAFSKTHYRNKERVIELFAKVEYEEMKKREKKKRVQ